MDKFLTITTPAADRTLLTLDELRAATGQADGRRDGDLLRLNERLAAALARVCRIAAVPPTPPSFRLETLTEEFRPCRAPRALYLSRTPVTTIVSVMENETALTASDWKLDPGTGELLRLSNDYVVAWCARKITVAYQAGWDIVPDDLKLAAAMTARLLWADEDSAGRDPNLKRERIEGATELEYWVPPASDPLLSAEITELLAPYINHTV